MLQNPLWGLSSLTAPTRLRTSDSRQSLWVVFLRSPQVTLGVHRAHFEAEATSSPWDRAWLALTRDSSKHCNPKTPTTGKARNDKVPQSKIKSVSGEGPTLSRASHISVCTASESNITAPCDPQQRATQTSEAGPEDGRQFYEVLQCTGRGGLSTAEWRSVLHSMASLCTL